jgi:hypothetical protein
VTFAVALVRSLTSALSAAVLFLGFIAIFWDQDRQAWHDKVAVRSSLNFPEEPRCCVYELPLRTDFHKSITFIGCGWQLAVSHSPAGVQLAGELCLGDQQLKQSRRDACAFLTATPRLPA